MKHIIILSVIILLGGACSSHNKDWDSGGDAQSAYQEQRFQEQVETMRKQVPEARPRY